VRASLGTGGGQPDDDLFLQAALNLPATSGGRVEESRFASRHPLDNYP
jgi:hypothetical protein